MAWRGWAGPGRARRGWLGRNAARRGEEGRAGLGESRVRWRGRSANGCLSKSTPRTCGFQGVSEGLIPYRLGGSRPFPFEPLNLRWNDPGGTSRSPVQDSLGIDSARMFRRSNASARRTIFQLQEGETLARFPADCSQNGALISNLRSACRLAQSAVTYRSFSFWTVWASVPPCSHRDQGEALDFSAVPEPGIFRIGAGTLGVISLRLSRRLC